LQTDLQLLSQLLDASVDGVFAFDRDLRVIAWNKAMTRITGISRDEAIGQNSLNASRVIADLASQSQLEKTLAGEGTVSQKLVPSLSNSIYRLYASPLTDSEGAVTGGVVILRDVTEPAQAEDDAHDAYRRLKFHVESSPLAVIEWDSDFRVSRWSESAVRLFGWNADEVIGKHVNEWQFVFADDVDAVEFVTNRQRQGVEVHGLLRNRNYTKDGAVLFCEWYNSVLHDESGSLVSVLSLVLDVTAKKLAEEERSALLLRERDARRQAEEADRLKDEFLATLSHELRTPLTSILGWASMIRTGEVDGANANRAMETIERNARSQARLIDDLLDVSRIITGNLRLDLHPLHVGPIIEAALDALRPTAAAKGIDLITDIVAGDCLVRGDTNRLRQIIWNLLSNAIKFTPRGGSVNIRLARGETSAQLTVSDSGEGISTEFLPFVFDRFRQAEGSISRKQGGLGLGLAVVRHLAELHGGNVSAASEGIGKGSTFTVDLPLAVERRDPARAEERRLEVERRKGLRRGLTRLDGVKVLLVEDDDDSRNLLTMMLKRQGAEVTAAKSAAQAFQVLTHATNPEDTTGPPVRRPDVVVSDIGMPEEDGYELIQKMRRLPANQGGLIPAIAVTGYATRKDRERALEAGYQVHMAKPIEQTELLTAIATLVQKK
jgi:PAS domain S-box-containing protein